MAGPLGVLPVGLGSPTTEDKDIDGGAPGGAAGMSDNGHHRS
jgi:hypothetical protein